MSEFTTGDDRRMRCEARRRMRREAHRRRLREIHKYGFSAGDLDGWVGSEATPTHPGAAWVLDDAQVPGSCEQGRE